MTSDVAAILTKEWGINIGDLNKMVDSLQMTILHGLVWMKVMVFGFEISMKFVLKGPIDNMWQLVIYLLDTICLPQEWIWNTCAIAV